MFLRKDIAGFLENSGADVMVATSLAEARNCLADEPFDFALCDIHLPDGNALDLLRQGAFPATTAVVVMTAEGGVETAVEAMRLGAGDYLSKPFETEELPLVFGRLAQHRQQARAAEHARAQAPQDASGLFFGARLASLQAQLDRILAMDARLGTQLPPVLLEGETGTGKSTLARWIHHQGPRASAPLIEVNCSTLPEQLAESELFGHEKGAFTDARKARIGLFEAADGGTLFLDEISSLPLSLQAKVLTAIEDRKIRRVGGNRALPVDTRIIAASLRDLPELVAEGQFREDLFHRLNLLRLRLPSLREQPGDIPTLAEHLLSSLRERYRLPDATISPTGRSRLAAHPWPGNVRELAHELERALIFQGETKLDFAHLGNDSDDSPTLAASATDPAALLNPAFALPEDGFAFEDALRELEQRVLRQAIDACGGNISAAARRLGVPRDFVRYRLKSEGN